MPSCGTWDRLSGCHAVRLFLRSLRNDKVGNLEYALSLEPSSNLLKDRLDAAKAKRAEGLPTVPSTLLEAPAPAAVHVPHRACADCMCAGCWHSQEQEHNPFFLALNSEGVDDLTELSRLRRGDLS